MIFNFILYSITIFICVLVAIAFFTLLERKILGYIQLRKGPNKVRLLGIPQPIADAVKLFTKQLRIPISANILPFIFAPILGLFLALIIWTTYPHSRTPLPIKWNVILFLALSRINVYTTLFAGWSANRKYSLLGALRSIAQTISYEVSIALIILTPLILINTVSLNNLTANHSIIFILIIWPLFTTWLISCLAETNRTPFDLAEGESELVSGFNTEYSSGTFALIFIAEYINIIVIGIIRTALFISLNISSNTIDILIIVNTTIIRTIFIWARGAYPRIRYDLLISLTWKQFLPLTLVIIIIVCLIIKWCCAGRTDNLDVVKYGNLPNIFLRSLQSNEFLLHK